MQIYLVRHGETDWNRENRLQGQTDIPLNNTGISQAYQLRQKINARNLKFDAVYVSPLQRTLKTAQIIVPGFPITLDNNLRERNAGQFEGKDPALIFDGEIDFLDETLNSDAFGVEPIRDFHSRAVDFLQNLQVSYPDNAKILVVSSNGLMKRLVSIITETPFDRIPNFQNAEIYEYNLISHV